MTLAEVEKASSFSMPYHYVWATVARIGRTPIERSVHIIRKPKNAGKATSKTGGPKGKTKKGGAKAKAKNRKK